MRRRKLISFVSLRADKEMAEIARDDVNEHLIATKLMLGRYCIMMLINESSNYYNRSYKFELNREDYAARRGRKRKREREVIRSIDVRNSSRGFVRSCCPPPSSSITLAGYSRKENKYRVAFGLYGHTRESFPDSRYRKLRLSTPPRRHASVVFFLTPARWNPLTGFGVNHKKQCEVIAALDLFVCARKLSLLFAIEP